MWVVGRVEGFRRVYILSCSFSLVFSLVLGFIWSFCEGGRVGDREFIWGLCVYWFLGFFVVL